MITKRKRQITYLATVASCLVAAIFSTNALAEIDRGMILKETGVFGIVATFTLHADWDRMSSADRRGASAEVVKVVDKYRDDVLVDAYLTRGLSAGSDYFLRVHSYDLAKGQAFMVDFRRTLIGRYSKVTETLVGVTKSLNYVTADMSPELNKGLKSATYQDGSPRYVIVIPVQKNAAWWNMTAKQRLGMAEGHTIPTLKHLVSVKRKLYHSTGLSDIDFITYFEMNDLTAFNELVIALMSVPENLYHTRYGDPIILGTIHSVKDVFETLAK